MLRAAHQRTPLIKFLGKRTVPSMAFQPREHRRSNANPSVAESVDHEPHAHPAAPSSSLPDNFASYRSKVQQHGPLGGQASASPSSSSSSSTGAYGAIGGHSGHELGSIEPKKGEFFDRSELPARFRKTPWTEEEMEAVTSGGASMH